MSNKEESGDLDPADAGDVLLLDLPLAELQNGPVCRVPDEDAGAERHRHVVQARPVHQVQVEVVDHVRRVQDLLRGGCNLSAR
jgi:hypothetical protein